MEKTYYTLINAQSDSNDFRLYCSPHFYSGTEAGKVMAENFDKHSVDSKFLKVVKVSVKIIDND